MTERSARDMAGLLALFALVALAIYSPALRGDFVSDDLLYLWKNPTVALSTAVRIGSRQCLRRAAGIRLICLNEKGGCLISMTPSDCEW